MAYRWILILLWVLPVGLQAQRHTVPEVLVGKLTATTGPLKTWTPDPADPALRVPTRDQKGLIFARDLQPLIRTNYGSRHHGEDPVLQKRFGRLSSGGLTNQAYGRTGNNMTLERDGGTVGQNLPGIPYTGISPADPTFAVGPHHIINMVNGAGGSAMFTISDKSGNVLTPLAYFDQLPGASFNGAGDCITWYDQLTDRYIMSEFGDSSKTGAEVNSLIMAVSTSDDPTGSWYIYEFTDRSFFPDYPKYANWSDAWYATTRDFFSAYAGSSVWAFNKVKMIAGDPAPEVQRVRLTDPDNKYNSICPVALAGNTPPPAGAPGMFMYYSDNDFTSSPTDADSIGIVTFKVNFADPTKSFAQVAQNMEVAAFKSSVCDSRNCAPSPSGSGYDVLSTTVMNRPWYRNFGGHEDIVLNHTVDADGNGLSALRWYQLRRSSGSWSVAQQGTFSPQEDRSCAASTPVHRFMGAITINGNGQVAMGYNTSGYTRNASLTFTGRNDGDPSNLMSYAETDATVGTGYGTFSFRWGDYSDIQPDIDDDSLFWFTGMYGESDAKWNTRVFSFRLRPNLNLDARLVSIDQPNDCNNPCTLNVAPKITIRNLGNQALHDLDVFLSVNGGASTSSHWSGNLPIATEASYTLPLTTLPPGTDTLTIFLSNPNGGSDQNFSNDTVRVTVTVGASAALPLSEGFESVLFPPVPWTLIGTGSATNHWSRSTNASHSGTSSVWMNNYQTNEPGTQTDLRTPVLDIGSADSSDLSFYYGAGLVSPDKLDTLEVLVSSDCGKTFQSLWKKWGLELATRNGYVANPYIPTASEWRRVGVDLTPFKSAGKLIVAFRNSNAFGNNIWLDDINIESVNFPKTDAQPLTLASPKDIICTNEFVPYLTIVNMGKDSLKTLDIQYQVDGGQPILLHWTGALARLDGNTITLSASSLNGNGAHNIVFLTSNPNGFADGNPANDTLKTRIYVQPNVNLPQSEGFDGGIPPTGWAEVHDARIKGWQSYNGVSPLGGSSVFMQNYQDTAANARASLITPVYQVTEADSVFFNFNLAAATYSYPGSTDIPLDTLEIFVSTDCGITYTSVYKKWGAALQTLGDPNNPHTSAYYPGPGDNWRLEHIDLTSSLAGSQAFLVRIRCTSNHENNIFIDNVQAYSKNLPNKLKENGFLVNPNPFHDRISLRFYPDASKVLGWELFSSTGQLVKKADFGIGTAPVAQEIPLNGLASGTYALRIKFSDRKITQKLIRQ